MTESDGKILINGEQYKVDVMLYNASGSGKIFKYDELVGITIHENLFDPFFTAELSYVDDMHAVEKGANIESSVIGNVKFPPVGYSFRGDGHDIVHISIKPISENDKSPLTFDGLFNVIQTARSLDNNTGKWIKTLILQDYWYQLLSERQSFFNTINPKNKYNAQLSNADRSMLTGLAIATLINETVGDNVEEIIDLDHWNNGGGSVFYSAGVNEKALTTLLNLYKLHNSNVAFVNDKCYLEHSISNGKWSLQSLNNLYNSALIKDGSNTKCGGNHVDRINLENSNDSSPAMLSKYTPTDVFLHEQSGNALYYDFKDIESVDAVKLNSHIVYNYNTTDKAFTVDMVDGNIDKFRDFFYNTYTTKMIGKNDKPYPNIPLTNKRLANQTISNIFNLYDNVNVSVGRNQMIDIANIMNNSIEVSTKGNTMRHPGAFISIDSTTSGVSNDFNSKIYGDYLILSADHTFIDNNYTTTLICSKPYTYSQTKSNPEVPING